MKKWIPLTLLIAPFSLFGGWDCDACCSPDSVEERCWYNKLDVGVDWLYWEAEQSQMDAFSHNVVTTYISVEGPVSINNYSPINPDFQYSSGARLYGNYELSSCWYLDLVGTYLHSKADYSLSLNPANYDSDYISFNDLYPIFSFQSGTTISSLSEKWILDIGYFDLNVRRNFLLCSCIDIEPYLGLRGACMRQKADVEAIVSLEQGGGTVTALLNTHLYGIGMQSGIASIWNLPCGFSLKGQFGGSLLYSKIRYESSGDFFYVGSPVYHESFDAVNIYKAIPTFDFSLGLQYSRCVCSRPIDLYACWEGHFFFHVNQQTMTGDGNLTMQGLTAGTRVHF